jgi:hypothetical protein
MRMHRTGFQMSPQRPTQGVQQFIAPSFIGLQINQTLGLEALLRQF